MQTQTTQYRIELLGLIREKFLVGEDVAGYIEGFVERQIGVAVE